MKLFEGSSIRVIFLFLIFGLGILPLSIQISSAASPVANAEKVNLVVDGRNKAQDVKIAVELYFPKGSKAHRVPAMVLMHGTAGVREREFNYANDFIKMGVATAIIYSFKSRGITDTFADSQTVPLTEMARDAMSTIEALSKDPRIDPKRIGLIGWSKGGGVAIKIALDHQARRLSKSSARFALHIAMYPACESQHYALKTTGAPLYMLLGERDEYDSPDSCKDYAKKITAAGGDVHVQLYKDARHGWDAPGRERIFNVKGENYSRCHFEENADGSWLEKTSGVIAFGPGGKPANRARAVAGCMTKGVVYGYSEKATEKSTKDITDIIGKAFSIQH
jgi:dienelactone hydrolase